MSFENIVKRVTPSLRKTARHLNGHHCYFDDDDLYQEAVTHLWLKYKHGALEGKNYTYIMRGCYFHIKNYLRKARSKAKFVNLDDRVNGTEITFAEIIPDNKTPLDRSVESKLLIEKIRHNGLSKREKEVFNLSLCGHTVREIGKKLDISHVRVVKLRYKIRLKYRDLFLAAGYQ